MDEQLWMGASTILARSWNEATKIQQFWPIERHERELGDDDGGDNGVGETNGVPSTGESSLLFPPQPWHHPLFICQEQCSSGGIYTL